jgi:arginyl-tRNA synthetase
MPVWFNPARELDALLRKVAPQVAGLDSHFDPELRPSDPRHADFQANGVLAAAKRAKQNPRVLATSLLEAVRASGELDETLIVAEVAGPGFINFKLTPIALGAWLKEYRDESKWRAGAAKIMGGKKVVIDYPSPNTAKQMHVGHLRPIVIGEAVARLIEFCGAELIRDNHIGDWGTNFGILILAIRRSGFKLDAKSPTALEDLERLYKEGSLQTKADPAALDAARAELAKLQTGDAENLKLWEEIVQVSNAACQRIYDQFGLKSDVILGESFYRDKVNQVYTELQKCGLAEESEGALVVWDDEEPRFSRHAETKMPFIVRKKDGSSNYASTDLATLLYRTEHFKAEEIVYVTDGRQQDHFHQLFRTGTRWFNSTQRKLPRLRHVWFGTILGEDGKAIKTKSGDPVRLQSLIDEATERAYAAVTEKSPEFPESERRMIAQKVGVAALRYVDLASNRTMDYSFSWSKLLAFEGNTAPYLMYAAVRVRSIFRKSGIALGQGEEGASDLETPEEISLARKLLGFTAALDSALEDLRPHHLCTYLHELAAAYGTFYAANSVNDPTLPAATKARRLMLCARTCSILETGLRLLAIEPVERM